MGSISLCRDDTDPQEAKGTEGEVQQGRGSFTFTIELYKNNDQSDERSVYRSTGRAIGGSHIISMGNVIDWKSEMNQGSSVLSKGSRMDCDFHMFRCCKC